MSQIVVDTDVASYIFNWHAMAHQYVNAFRGSDLILSCMSVAELRIGAMSAGWGGVPSQGPNAPSGVFIAV
jgi:hypothetical protein